MAEVGPFQLPEHHTWWFFAQQRAPKVQQHCCLAAGSCGWHALRRLLVGPTSKPDTGLVSCSLAPFFSLHLSDSLFLGHQSLQRAGPGGPKKQTSTPTFTLPGLRAVDGSSAASQKHAVFVLQVSSYQ